MSRHTFHDVGTLVASIPDGYDVHTVLLVLNGQHGEFDLRVEATDDDLEDHAWTGIVGRYGGVRDWRKVPEPEAASKGVQIA